MGLRDKLYRSCVYSTQLVIRSASSVPDLKIKRLVLVEIKISNEIIMYIACD